MQPLLAVSDAYQALLADHTRHSRAIAANQLLKIVPVHSAVTFKKAFGDMSVDVPLARLEGVLGDAFFLARDAISGAFDPTDVAEVHEQNSNWLTGTITRTGCSRKSGAAGTGQTGAQTFPEPNARENAERRQEQKAAQASVLIAVLIAGIVCIACFAIYQSRHFRIKRVQRLPRHAVAFKASATFNDTDSPIIVLDISIGGAKIECDHPPVAKQPISVHLPCGTVSATIVWATAFYAGVMFETRLSDAELKTILSDDSVTTRSRLSNLY